MRKIHLEDDEVLASFDISSLFTNIAVEVIQERLMEDETLPERTDLSPTKIGDLSYTCLRSTCFTYRGEYYEQRDEAAMGSPVSVILADLYMEFFEDIALHSAPSILRLWKRYVDDTCCIIKRGEVDQLLQHLTSIHPSVKFTVEVEREGKLPFLDNLLRRNSDGSLDIMVYRKPTHTDRYLSFQLTPEGERFNRDEGMELPGCWAAAIKAITRQRGRYANL